MDGRHVVTPGCKSAGTRGGWRPGPSWNLVLGVEARGGRHWVGSPKTACSDSVRVMQVGWKCCLEWRRSNFSLLQSVVTQQIWAGVRKSLSSCRGFLLSPPPATFPPFLF